MKKERTKRGNRFVNIYVVEVVGMVHAKDAND
jgi:Tfp pilus tip-associated adhesin PilY1